MRKKLALIAILATALALPASGALARGGGGGGGGHGGGGFGGGHMGGGFSGGHMGGGFAGGHVGGSHLGALGGGRAFGSNISPQARAAFGAAGHGHFHGRFGHRRVFFGSGLGYDNSCWDGYAGPYGWQCTWPDEY